MKAAELLRLGELFQELEWSTENDPDAQFPRHFERFCRMWNRLDGPHRELVLTITKSYIWIKPDSTGKRFLAAWRQMIPLLPVDTETVAVAPFPKSKDAGPKSFDFVHYLATRGYALNLEESLGTRKLRICPSLASYGARPTKRKTTLMLVDDYVGSGDSALRALAELKEVYPDARPNAIFVVAVAAQSAAVARLRANGYTLVAESLLERGITDSKLLPDISEALQLMDQLGEQLGLEKELRLGYGASEALVTLTRTPNNTFPVYWTNKKVGGVVWDAPFPR